MTKQSKGSGDLLVRSNLCHAALVYQKGETAQPMARAAIREIETHLGGSDVLRELGAGAMVADSNHVSFTLTRNNPKGVRSVVITAEPSGDFHMDFYGERQPGWLSAPRVASAGPVLPESLATVLGQLTGLEMVHHRHF